MIARFMAAAVLSTFVHGAQPQHADIEIAGVHGQHLVATTSEIPLRVMLRSNCPWRLIVSPPSAVVGVVPVGNGANLTPNALDVSVSGPVFLEGGRISARGNDGTSNNGIVLLIATDHPRETVLLLEPR